MKYPEFKQIIGEKPGNLDGVKIDRAQGGAVRTRSTWDKCRRSITVHHLLTPAQHEELWAFYNAHRAGGARFDFEWRADKKIYCCIFSGPPDDEPINTGDGRRWRVACALLEV